AGGTPLPLLDARLTLGMQLVEADGRRRIRRREHANRNVDEADLQIAFPGWACGHGTSVDQSRDTNSGVAPPPKPTRWTEDPAKVRPMLATAPDSTVKIPLQGAGLWYEPKYDGIRALVAIEPGHPLPHVRLWSRNGNEKTTQFPDLIKALQDM